MKEHIESHFLNLQNSEDLNEFFYFVASLKLKNNVMIILKKMNMDIF